MIGPTPYPEVNPLLADLLEGVQGALGGNLSGLYLYGSLALGDFDLKHSDIDFLAAVTREPSPEEVARLTAMHLRLEAKHPRWATEVEGSYIPLADLRRYDPSHARHLHVYDGRVGFEVHGAHWVIERHVTREHGVVLAGPAPALLIDPVSPAQLRRAVTELLRTWWAPIASERERLVDPDYRRYAVLTMCRALYTLRHGAILSKPKAVAWACSVLPDRWRRLIEHPDDAVEAAAFIQYVEEATRE